MRPKRKLVATLLFSTAATFGAGCATDEDGAPPDEMAEPQLLELRTELTRTAKPDALARVAHFRPICDEAGYPLVGNVANKGPSEIGYQPSQFCGEVRALGE